MEVEGFLLLVGEELQNFDKQFSDFGVDIDVLLGLLADLVGEVEEAVLYLFVALLVEPLLHVVQTVEELKQSQQAADDLDLQKLLFVGLAVLHTVVSLGDFRHDVD